jgi:hypothetical protein
MPIVARLALVIAVVSLAGVVLATVSGALPRVVGSIGAAFGGLTDPFLATPTPAVEPIPIPPSPTLVAPEVPATNAETVTISGTVPGEIAGRSGFVVRIYIAIPDEEPVPVRDVPVGETPSFVASGLPLEKGRNDITATIVGPGGESDPSPVITYVRDTAKPKITITSPKDGATVNRANATIKGKTQAGATIVARNEANGTSATAIAKSDGTFTLKIPISPGTNGIAFTATDPAGNEATAVVSIRRGSGKLAIALSASAYRISVRSLPRSIEIEAIVTDPDGRPLRGEVVTFTFTVPGVPAITGEEVTAAGGVATFRTTIPAGATRGSGLATAFVDSAEHGEASARTSITLVR